MRLQDKFNFDDSGVSPVVGVILMVAITVILAAVIANFVLGLGGQVQQNAQAGVTFDENVGNNVEVQLNSVQSADYIYVESSSSDATYNTSAGNENVLGGVGSGSYEYNGGGTVENFLLNDGSGGAGTTVTVEGNAYASGETVSVIGVLEGSENVIQTFDMSS